MNREQLDKLHQVAICSLNETQRAVDNATTAVIAAERARDLANSVVHSLAQAIKETRIVVGAHPTEDSLRAGCGCTPCEEYRRTLP